MLSIPQRIREAYEPVQQEDDGEMYGLPVKASQRRPKALWLSSCFLAIICICTIIDTVLVVGLLLQRTYPALSSMKQPELRSSYVNLDVLYRNKSTPRTQVGPIINHAPAFYQVSSAHPDKVQPVYTDFRLMNVGVVPLYVRHLVANASTSSIAQFRVMDFGMELCTLMITVPPRNETEDVISGQENGPGLIDIWSLPGVKGKIDYERLTWATKPRERKFFDSLQVDYGASFETPRFSCASLSYQTFEISCSERTPYCNIDIMGQGSQSSGLHMWQYQSI